MPEVSAIPAKDVDSPKQRNGVSPPVTTWVMSGLCVMFTLAHHTSAHLTAASLWYRIGQFGHLPATAIWDGQWAALFTTFFIHGDPNRPWLTLMHLGFNVLVLMQTGRVLEATLHPVAYYVFFVAAAVVGSGAELAMSGSTGVGASGVVYAMFGLLWAGRRYDKDWAEVADLPAVALVVGWAFVCVILTRLNVINIANAAHFAGLLFGLAVGWVFVEHRYRILGGLILTGLATVVVLSLAWLPWSPYWTCWKGVQARKHLRYDEAIEWFRRSEQLGYDFDVIEHNIAEAEFAKVHPELGGMFEVVPDQPGVNRFGTPPATNVPPFLNVPRTSGDH